MKEGKVQRTAEGEKRSCDIVLTELWRNIDRETVKGEARA